MDRHGNVRIYVAVPGRKKVRIRETPGTKEFTDAYNDAVEGVTPQPRSQRGTFGYVCKAYYASKVFQALDIGTQKWRRQVLDKICEKDALKPVARLRPDHIEKLRDEMPTAITGNHRLKGLKALFKWAVPKHAPHNPAVGVARLAVKSKGHHTWTLDEIQQYEAKHVVGTKARLALDLIRYTTCRREDVTRLGPQHARNGRLVYTQGKNEHRDPVHMDIPIHPELQKSIDATPTSHLVFVPNEWGRAFTPNSFNAWFRKRRAEAGLPARCTPHGIRKFTSTDLADHGATGHEIQSLTGHKTLAQVEVYTAAANRKRLADSAMVKLQTANTDTPTVDSGGRKTVKNR